MERTSPSMSYRHLRHSLDEHLAEQRHRNLWLFLYSSRHAHLQLLQPHGPNDVGLQERNQLIDETVLLLKKFSLSELWQFSPSTENLAAELNEFCFGITYAFHKEHFGDGFVDLLFEQQLPFYNEFINQLSRNEMSVVSRLHDLNYKYGFLITELWLPLIRSADLINSFVIKNLKIQDLDPIPSFIFTKKGNHPKGIQISTKEYPKTIIEPWDLVVLINEQDKLSNIKEKVSHFWPHPGKQIIGDYNDYNIALYVDRNNCKISNVLSTLRLQIDHFKDYTNGLMLIPDSEELSSLDNNKSKAKKEMRRRLSSTIDRLRLSEGFVSKRWNITKSNARRSIGLYLWDQMNFASSRRSRKSLIADLIEELKSDKPETLDLYLGNFNKYDSPEKTTKFGDSLRSLETVTRGIEADFDLTAKCIKKFEYLAPHHVKTGGNKLT